MVAQVAHKCHDVTVETSTWPTSIDASSIALMAEIGDLIDRDGESSVIGG